MMIKLSIKTHAQTEMISIETQIQKAVDDSGVKDGLCCVYIPHTTAAVTINEGADPSVVDDMLKELNRIVPFENNYSHMEGNSAAHIKTTLVGPQVTIIIEDGKLQLGTWQSVFFCEFDGPRNRHAMIKII
ncbi:MAG: secondary thiamine-phosphate synthase enzyme YjbQ [candidate division KSB1 bacterium]|jgi:secondary thiamine-phosphate synthase enzyme|nr:secondary thiamine-phosphate synthase enzyme YjbQ [candidate division KSB1 bacterium]